MKIDLSLVCEGDPWPSDRKNEEEWRAAKGVTPSVGTWAFSFELEQISFQTHFGEALVCEVKDP